MDGGGRFLRPLSAGLPGRAGARASLLAATAALAHRFAPQRSPPFRSAARLPIVFFGIGWRSASLGPRSVGGHVDGRSGSATASTASPCILARFLGLGLDQVTIAGIARLTEPEVLAAAGISPKVSLPFSTPPRCATASSACRSSRARRCASSTRTSSSSTLVEREPHALWQHNGELFVIAADGTVIDTLQDGRFAHLPLVVGEDANLHTADYLALLEAAGPLRGAHPRRHAGLRRAAGP